MLGRDEIMQRGELGENKPRKTGKKVGAADVRMAASHTGRSVSGSM